MVITFQHPPIASPFTSFSPANAKEYPKSSGVYIYGLKINIDGFVKFVPLYVGTANDLGKRLLQHYQEERTGGNSKWFVFDYAKIKTKSDVNQLYESMRIADQKPEKLAPRHLHRFSDFLIWFNDATFFENKLRLPLGSSSYISNSGVLKSLNNNGDLVKIESSFPGHGANDLKNKIEDAKKCFNDNFYYLYADLNTDVVIEDHDNIEIVKLFNDYKNSGGYIKGPGDKLARKIENAAKNALFKLGIYTCAKANGTKVEMKIDLSKVQNDLVMLNQEIYLEPLEYKDPLVIKAFNNSIF